MNFFFFFFLLSSCQKAARFMEEEMAPEEEDSKWELKASGWTPRLKTDRQTDSKKKHEI